MSDIDKKYQRISVTHHDELLQKVIKDQQTQVDALSDEIHSNSSTLNKSIEDSENLLKQLGVSLPEKNVPARHPETLICVKRDWHQIQEEAERNVAFDVALADILTESDIANVDHRISHYREMFDLEHKLDLLDWSISGVAGLMAALVDIFLVKIPSSAGLGGGQPVKGGYLSDLIREKLKNMYSPQEIQELEKEFAVPYDASTSKDLLKKVSGLGPRTHRLQSLGHDPILGFIFGVRDIMNGTMTAIDASGHIITQSIAGAKEGVSFFEALAIQLGHLKSDIGTAAGLPPPFLSLFQLLNFGNIGGRTISQLCRTMYAKGYDFGHFLAMGIPVMMIEVIVRMLYFAKRLHDGKSFAEALPFNMPGYAHQPRLQTMLFTAHTVATAFNAGKIAITKNPLSINMPQWLLYAQISLQQLKWVLLDKEMERLDFTQDKLDVDSLLSGKNFSIGNHRKAPFVPLDSSREA